MISMGTRLERVTEMAIAVKRGIREACPDEKTANALCAGVNALVEELTKDDEPVFRAPLGAWRKHGPT